MDKKLKPSDVFGHIAASRPGDDVGPYFTIHSPTPEALLIRPRGTGDMGSVEGEGFPIMIEFYKDEDGEETCKLHVWGSINQEDPTHVIDLEGAMEHNYVDQESQ